MPLPFYAIVCTWNEESIIASTVRHAFAQGCRQVFIVDNGSTDNTIERAVSAGAFHHSTFITRFFNEDSKIIALNDAVSKLNACHKHKRAWWLYIDADEFPTPPRFPDLLTFIEQLHPDVRAVKSKMINHFPTHPPYFLEGFHPIDFQAWGTLINITKYQLLRYDYGKEHITSLGGAHDYYLNGGKRLPASLAELNLHHFYLCSPEASRRRLAELARVREDGTSRLDWMDKFEQEAKGVRESMYRKRLHEIDNTLKNTRNAHHFAPNTEFWDFKTIPRWYDWDVLYQAVQENTEPAAALEFTSQHLFLREQFDQALIMFDRLLAHYRETGKSQALPLYFMGQCFLSTNDPVTARMAFKEALACRPELDCLLKIKEALIACDNNAL